MGNQKPAAEPSAVAFLVDSEAAGILQGALDNMKLGPGKPGPGDEWKMPLGPIDETVTQDDEAVPEPARSGHRGLLRRLTKRVG